MHKQTPGRIYLADQRGVVRSPQFQRYSTLSFGAYQHPARGAVGTLLAANEEWLAGGQTAELPAANDAVVLLLPITGALEINLSGQSPRLADVGTVCVLPVAAGQTIGLHNPYPDDLISCLHLWLRPTPAPTSGPQQFDFVPAALENRLLPLLPAAAGLPVRLSLGRFAGRTEARYRPQPGSALFAFVLAGAFELQGRLLHEKDGLALWETDEIDLEALSNDALLLLLEVPA